MLIVSGLCWPRAKTGVRVDFSAWCCRGDLEPRPKVHSDPSFAGFAGFAPGERPNKTAASSHPHKRFMSAHLLGKPEVSPDTTRTLKGTSLCR